MSNLFCGKVAVGGNYNLTHDTILDEKDAGYYAFVLVGSNRIIRYSEEEGWYKFENK